MGFRMRLFDDFLLALAYLTRLPVRLSAEAAEHPLSRAAAWFPFIGLIVATLGAVAFLAAYYFGLPSSLAALVAVLFMMIATGALHEDGLADFADAQGAADPERRLAIMRDSRIGSFGVLALILAIAFRAGALGTLASPFLVFNALLASQTLSRAMVVLAMLMLPDARPDGLAARAGKPSANALVWALAVAAATALLALGPGPALAALLAALAAALAIMALAQAQLGGKTGDVLGAVQVSAEVAALLAAIAVVGVSE